MEDRGLLPDVCVHLVYDEGPPHPSVYPYRRAESIPCKVRESQRVLGQARVRLPGSFEGIVTRRDRLRVVSRRGKAVKAQVYALQEEPVLTPAGLICEVAEVR